MKAPLSMALVLYCGCGAREQIALEIVGLASCASDAQTKSIETAVDISPESRRLTRIIVRNYSDSEIIPVDLIRSLECEQEGFASSVPTNSFGDLCVAPQSFVGVDGAFARTSDTLVTFELVSANLASAVRDLDNATALGFIVRNRARIQGLAIDGELITSDEFTHDTRLRNDPSISSCASGE